MVWLPKTSLRIVNHDRENTTWDLGPRERRVCVRVATLGYGLREVRSTQEQDALLPLCAAHWMDLHGGGALDPLLTSAFAASRSLESAAAGAEPLAELSGGAVAQVLHRSMIDKVCVCAPAASRASLWRLSPDRDAADLCFRGLQISCVCGRRR